MATEPTLAQIFLGRVRRTPQKCAFRFRQQGQWASLTYKDLLEKVRGVAAGLEHHGFHHSPVMILSHPRVEVSILELALLSFGRPILLCHPHTPSNEVEMLYQKFQPQSLIIDHRTSRLNLGFKTVLELKNNVESNLLPLIEAGRELLRQNPHAFTQRMEKIRAEDPCYVRMTSGIVGEPRILLTRHQDRSRILNNALQSGLGRSLEGNHSEEESLFLSSLPVSNPLQNLELDLAFAQGKPLAFPGLDLLQDLNESKPAELLMDQGRAKRLAARLLPRSGAAHLSPRFPEGQQREKKNLSRLGRWRRGRHLPFIRSLQRVWITGSPLDLETATQFETLGVEVSQLYYLTEVGVVAIGRPGQPLQPIEGIELSEGPQNELRVRFEGDERWIKTGDLGKLAPAPNSKKPDRLVLLLLGRKGIPQAAEALEKALQGCPLIDHAHTEEREGVRTALLSLNRAQVLKFAEENQILYSDYSKLLETNPLRNALRDWIEKLTLENPNWPQINRFLIVSDEFSIKSGELTLSDTLRRGKIRDKYRNEIEQLFNH